jgi:signal transduction histidine kinase
MTNENKTITASFKPRARILMQLGDQLIRNESIALIELVKNSYDADANEVTISMKNLENPDLGRIVIKDDGSGMTTDIVKNVWLEPGSDFKSKLLRANVPSPNYKRLPIGEKGIGRFGVHKLGNSIRMTTRAADSKEVFVSIDWQHFADAKYLEDAPIKIVERSEPKVFRGDETGTKLVIENLRKSWDRGTARKVKRALTSLVSPFESDDSFVVSFDILDHSDWLVGLLEWSQIKDFSLFHFKVEMAGDSITSFLYEFTPWPSMGKLSPKSVDLKDKLVDSFKKLKDPNTNLPISLSDYQIGKVTFEGFIFELDSFVLQMGVSDKSGFKDYLKENGGIRVFRDGLRVYDYGEPGNDWLGLDMRRVNQPSKKLSNNIVLGAVYLERQKSSDLEEKTNREGFVENEAYHFLKSAILHSVGIVENLRLIDKTNLKKIYSPTSKSAPVMALLAELNKYIEKEISDVKTKNKIQDYLLKIESDYNQVTENLIKAAGAGLSLSVVVHEAEKVLAEIAKVIKAESSSDRVIKLVQHLSSLIDGYAEIIRKSAQSHQNLIEMIQKAIFNVEFRLACHSITLEKPFAKFSGNPKVKIPKNLILGSLMNLFDNSIFWLEKAFEINPSLKKRIYINLVEDNEFIRLIMADNGTGFLIPTENVTEPFISGKDDGMGLGLHITSEIMLAQKGYVSFPDFYDFEIPENYKNGALIALNFKK